MYCKNCGMILPDNMPFCTKCGTTTSNRENRNAVGVSEGEPLQSAKREEGLIAEKRVGFDVAIALVAMVAVTAAFIFMGTSDGAKKDIWQNPIQPTSVQEAEANSSWTESAEIDTSSQEMQNTPADNQEPPSESQEAFNNEGAATGEEADDETEKAASAISLSVETATGETLVGEVTQDNDGYVIADSSVREYTVSELRALDLTDAELCVAWNEPFARQGYHFRNPGLQAYFNACSWYVDKGENSSLSGVAATNNALLRQIAEESSTSKKWMDLASR